MSHSTRKIDPSYKTTTRLGSSSSNQAAQERKEGPKLMWRWSAKATSTPPPRVLPRQRPSTAQPTVQDQKAIKPIAPKITLPSKPTQTIPKRPSTAQISKPNLDTQTKPLDRRKSFFNSTVPLSADAENNTDASSSVIDTSQFVSTTHKISKYIHSDTNTSDQVYPFPQLKVSIPDNNPITLKTCASEDEFNKIYGQSCQELKNQIEACFDALNFEKLIKLVLFSKNIYPKEVSFDFYRIAYYRYLGSFDNARQICDNLTSTHLHLYHFMSKVRAIIEVEMKYIQSKALEPSKCYEAIKAKLDINTQGVIVSKNPGLITIDSVGVTFLFPKVQYTYNLNAHQTESMRFGGQNFSRVSGVYHGGHSYDLLISENDPSERRLVETQEQVNDNDNVNSRRSNLAFNKIIYPAIPLIYTDIKGAGFGRAPLISSYHYKAIFLEFLSILIQEGIQAFDDILFIAKHVGLELNRIHKLGISLGLADISTILIHSSDNISFRVGFFKFSQAKWAAQGEMLAVNHDVSQFASTVDSMLKDCKEYPAEESLVKWIEQAKNNPAETTFPALQSFHELPCVKQVKPTCGFFNNLRERVAKPAQKNGVKSTLYEPAPTSLAPR